MLSAFPLTAHAEKSLEHFQMEFFNLKYDANLKDKFPATNLRFLFLIF